MDSPQSRIEASAWPDEGHHIRLGRKCARRLGSPLREQLEAARRRVVREANLRYLIGAVGFASGITAAILADPGGMGWIKILVAAVALLALVGWAHTKIDPHRYSDRKLLPRFDQFSPRVEADGLYHGRELTLAELTL